MALGIILAVGIAITVSVAAIPRCAGLCFRITFVFSSFGRLLLFVLQAWRRFAGPTDSIAIALANTQAIGITLARPAIGLAGLCYAAFTGSTVLIRTAVICLKRCAFGCHIRGLVICRRSFLSRNVNIGICIRRICLCRAAFRCCLGNDSVHRRFNVTCRLICITAGLICGNVSLALFRRHRCFRRVPYIGLGGLRPRSPSFITWAALIYRLSLIHGRLERVLIRGAVLLFGTDTLWIVRTAIELRFGFRARGGLSARRRLAGTDKGLPK